MRAVNTFLAWAGGQAGETIDAKAKLPAMGRRVLDVLSREEVTALEDAASTERDKLIVRLMSRSSFFLASGGWAAGSVAGSSTSDADGRHR